ncbi:SIS domain-containing protein [Halobacillus salinarum]|uniref:SIS domain-containing protein n=1 Tax=Halobacillus salinarum TaxID=2932257 RepID=A0ABY4EGS9_9BACI|nr:SIS domain-containing protein [Halobacillus salinarum]UOQ43273.1 SIS domain-containing protein [Halobacillus salinarum]
MQYLSKAAQTLNDLAKRTERSVDVISEQLAESIMNDGIIHLFGCGHSALLAQDSYYRAGGLAPVHPIMIDSLMLHKGGAKASRNEKKHGVVNDHLKSVDFQPQDCLIVISNSGRNPAPIEAALYGKETAKVLVIGLLSRQYESSQPSRHSSGRRLEDIVDLTLDSNVPVGDALLCHEEISQSYASLSTVVGAALLQQLFASTIEKLLSKGENPPIFLSGNVDGAGQHNQLLMDKYRSRITF